jgi:ADP-heptose:LPS heptosyltransferase
MTEYGSIVPNLGATTTPRIVIVRALPGLGDMLCAVPAARAIRRAIPNAEITLVGLEQMRPFANRFAGYFDSFLSLPAYPRLWEPDNPTMAGVRLARFLAEACRQQFDLAIQMHGSGPDSNYLTRSLGAALSAGFHPPGARPFGRWFFPYPQELPEVLRNLKLVECLGIPFAGDELEFPLLSSDYHELDSHLGDRKVEPLRYACVHAGARMAARRWLPEHFAAVADALAETGLRIVLSGGPDERELNQVVASRMTAPALNLASSMSAGALGALIHGARILVCNDTGVSHIAAALRVPSVVIFTAADPRRWAPLNGDKHCAVFEPVDCRPCSWEECPIGHPCAQKVTPEKVITRALALLERDYANAA